MNDEEVQKRVAATEQLLDDVEALADPKARFTATQALQLLLELYGEGLRRVMSYVQDGALQQKLVEDELVSHLLLLHGLHPVDAETRVQEALRDVRQRLEKRGAGVDLLGIEDGVARVRLLSGPGCHMTAQALQEMVETALFEAAPELLAVHATTPQRDFTPVTLFLDGKPLNG